MNDDVQAGTAGVYDTSDPLKWVSACRKHCHNSIMNTGVGAWLGTAVAVIESQAQRVRELEADAARWRYVRGNLMLSYNDIGVQRFVSGALHGNTPDEAIDKAMKETT